MLHSSLPGILDVSARFRYVFTLVLKGLKDFCLFLNFQIHHVGQYIVWYKKELLYYAFKNSPISDNIFRVHFIQIIFNTCLWKFNSSNKIFGCLE